MKKLIEVVGQNALWSLVLSWALIHILGNIGARATTLAGATVAFILLGMFSLLLILMFKKVKSLGLLRQVGRFAFLGLFLLGVVGVGLCVTAMVAHLGGPRETFYFWREASLWLTVAAAFLGSLHWSIDSFN